MRLANPALKVSAAQAWAACYNMTLTRKLRDQTRDVSVVVLTFATRARTSGGDSKFHSFTQAEKVRTTRRLVPCDRVHNTPNTLRVRAPLEFMSSIDIIASFYEKAQGAKAFIRHSLKLHGFN